MKYAIDLTDEQIAEIMAHEDELDRAYAEAAEQAALRAEDARDAEELEIEADLQRYWRP
jgi:hypothetical protein